MRINLAKAVPFVGVLLALVVYLAAQSSSGASDDGGYPSFGDPSYGGGTTRADRYLDKVAAGLAQPGLYVDRNVFDRDRLSIDDANTVYQAAARADGPQRIAVIPASAVAADDAGGRYGSGVSLAYEPEELVAQLYDRVGQDGVYAVLVDADSESAGRSFHAYQWAEDGPTYQVESAVDGAIDCCAPDYASMLTTFTARAESTAPPWGWILLGLAGAAGALIAGTKAWSALARRRQEAAADEEVVRELRVPLDEEVVELSTAVSSLPPGGDPDGPVAKATRTVLDLVEEARQLLDAMESPADAQAVTGRLADARYQLVVIAALRAGQEPPERTAPCFMDPRHGPSVVERPFTPERGVERTVPVCAVCRDALEAGQRPAVRQIEHDGRLELYWQAGPSSRPYVNGYWQRRAYPDTDFQRDRSKPAYAPPPERHDPPFEFVWDSDDKSGSGSAGGGKSFWSGGGGGRTSSRRSSFGGGRSSRSSSRGGGGRGF